MKLTIAHPNKDIESMNISGLAGKLQNGSLLGRHGSQVNVNATAYAIFDLSETWSLQNENESLFFYNITGGNYTVYNRHHTVPRFLETLVANLTELFKTFSPENITLFNKTCRNYWNGEHNDQCLLTIARTKDFSLGLDIMTEVNETRRKWEILHNKPPKFLDGMPRNITKVFKTDLYWKIDLKEYVSDDTDSPLIYGIQTSLPKEEYSLDNGVFNWTIGTGLRHIDTHFIFLATDRLNATARHEVSIQYCGCNEPVECKFDVGHSISTGTHMQKATCECLKYYEGDFCEKFTSPCENDTLKCYAGLCNSTVPRADPSDKTWPCSPCPVGRHEKFIGDKQNCEDIDECTTTEHLCHQGCDNTNGSYRCTCEKGYDLDSDGFHCSDIDECTDHKLCSQTEVCVNTIGSYTCNCAPGSMRHEETNTCVPIVAKTYVSTISFSVLIITQDGFDKDMVDTEENRNNIQIKLQERYKNSTGFVGVQVVKISMTIISENSARKKRANRQLAASLDAQYILYWENRTDTTTIQEALKNAYSVDSTNSLLEPDGIIPGLILTSVANISVNTDICSIPGQYDCDHSSAECVNLEGGYKCQCLAGYEYPEYSKKYCTEIDECKLFVNNNSVKDRCVHGSCVNVPGSWNCTCPEDRLWQSVGNDVPVYRCQGNYSYIGTIRVHMMSATSSEEEIVAFVKDQLNLTFGNKSLNEKAEYDTHISSIFVHATVLRLEEDISASYRITFNLRLGEIVDTGRLTSVMKDLSQGPHLHINNRSEVYFQDTHIFNDSENILCNLTSYGDCDERTTTCQQQNGKTYCRCKSGFEKRYEIDKFCRDVNECANATYKCLGGRCNNSPGQWSCECEERNFAPVQIDEFTMNCTDGCKNMPCDNGGTCRMINDDQNEIHFDCICAEGWTGSTCQEEYEQPLPLEEPETDLETPFIATGSTLGGLVILLSVAVLVVYRWRGAKVKEATKHSKRYLERDGFKPLEGSVIDEQYLDNTHNVHDISSESGFRTFPGKSSHGANAGSFILNDNPHSKSSLPNRMHADTNLNFEGNRMSLRQESERPASPLPDYSRTSNVENGGVPTNDKRRSDDFDGFGAPTKF
ncbi:fibrillin-2-like isoform X2 [Mercenaria mercenaria]|uniref:fibrillin-2-like isoform X2 n=1 Tax=Mercenaria mercenaria TaxID=6596 RepID=UPI00234F706F|nr:fibrillin-2-like isoform X2 [Mercenaria mercenaria]